MKGASWTNEKGEIRPLDYDDFMVVAPYNDHRKLVRAELKKLDLDDVPVGTVDKFQGQEAAVVFFTMASSSAEDMPRGLDFLFSTNRLNVAISRAKCLAYIVCTDQIFSTRAKTVEDMKLISALLTYLDFCEPEELPSVVTPEAA